jgi:serine/threonine-protein kinase
VLIGPEGAAKVTDFGIARSLEDEGLTAAGRVLGTTDYVSPEQAVGHDVTGQTDIYSLGVVLYEMLTGEVPFEGESPVAVAMKHVREDFPDVRVRRPDVSVSVARVVDRMTAKDLHARYPDAQSVIRDLEETLALEAARTGQATGEATSVLRTLPSDTRRRLPLRMRWHPPLIALLLIVGVALAVLGLGGKGLIDRTQRGTGKGTIQESPGTEIVSVRGTSAHTYDPLGDDAEHDDSVARVVDRDSGTVWTTETYQNNTFGTKAGVGIYVDAAPRVRAENLIVQTPTPGWRAEIYGITSRPPALEPTQSLSGAGWQRLTAGTVRRREQRFKLETGDSSFRYYLVWATELPPNEPRIEVSEIALERRR